jgi:hypothetical protein
VDGFAGQPQSGLAHSGFHSHRPCWTGASVRPVRDDILDPCSQPVRQVISRLSSLVPHPSSLPTHSAHPSPIRTNIHTSFPRVFLTLLAANPRSRHIQPATLNPPRSGSHADGAAGSAKGMAISYQFAFSCRITSCPLLLR